jgi:hypothetical protein
VFVIVLVAVPYYLNYNAVACMKGTRNAYKILIGKSFGKLHLRRPQKEVEGEY